MSKALLSGSKTGMPVSIANHKFDKDPSDPNKEALFLNVVFSLGPGTNNLATRFHNELVNYTADGAQEKWLKLLTDYKKLHNLDSKYTYAMDLNPFTSPVIPENAPQTQANNSTPINNQVNNDINLKDSKSNAVSNSPLATTNNSSQATSKSIPAYPQPAFNKNTTPSPKLNAAATKSVEINISNSTSSPKVAPNKSTAGVISQPSSSRLQEIKLNNPKNSANKSIEHKTTHSEPSAKQSTSNPKQFTNNSSLHTKSPLNSMPPTELSDFQKDVLKMVPDLDLQENIKLKNFFLSTVIAPQPPSFISKFKDLISNDIIELINRYFVFHKQCLQYEKIKPKNSTLPSFQKLESILIESLDLKNCISKIPSDLNQINCLGLIDESKNHIEKLKNSIGKKEKRLKKIDDEIAILLKEKESLNIELEISKQKLVAKEDSFKKIDIAKITSITFTMYKTIGNYLVQFVDEELNIIERNITENFATISQSLSDKTKTISTKKQNINKVREYLEPGQYLKLCQEFSCFAEELVFHSNTFRNFLLHLKQDNKLTLLKKDFFDSFSVNLTQLITLCDSFCSLFEDEIKETVALIIFSSDKHMGHCTGDHPENAHRLEWVLAGIKQKFPKKTGNLPWEGVAYKNTTRMANKSELNLAHSPDYVTKILQLMKALPECIKYWKQLEDNKNQDPPIMLSEHRDPLIRDMVRSIRFDVEPLYKYDTDTVISLGTHDAALLGVGSVIEAVESVMNFKALQAFCVVRPPGHHAGVSGRTHGAPSSGFCLFNNVAVGALYSNSRVLIFDFDVHHGNGTQNIVSNRENIAFISTHVVGNGFYPQTGYQPGDANNILNIPLREDFTPEYYMEVYYTKIVPFISSFKPDLIMISAGFDARNGELMLSKSKIDEKENENTNEIENEDNEDSKSASEEDNLIIAENFDMELDSTIDVSKSLPPLLSERPKRKSAIAANEEIKSHFENVESSYLVPNNDTPLGKRKRDSSLIENVNNSEVANSMYDYFGIDEDEDEEDEEDEDFDVNEIDSDNDLPPSDLPEEFYTNLGEFIGLNADHYYKISSSLGQLARQYCHGRIVSVLEGGYGEDHMSEVVVAHLNGIMDGAKSFDVANEH